MLVKNALIHHVNSMNETANTLTSRKNSFSLEFKKMNINLKLIEPLFCRKPEARYKAG